MPKRRSQTRDSQVEIENPNEPGPSRRRTSDMSNTSLLNQSIDYVALVEQHLKDEQMARDLQRAENSLQPSSASHVRDSAVQVSGGSDPLRRVDQSSRMPRGSAGARDDFNDVIIEEEDMDFSDDDEFHDADEGEPEPPGEVINIESDSEGGDEDLDRYEESFINDATVNVGLAEDSDDEESSDGENPFHLHADAPVEENYEFPARRQGLLVTRPHTISPFHMHIQGNRESLGSLLAARSASVGRRAGAGSSAAGVGIERLIESHLRDQHRRIHGHVHERRFNDLLGSLGQLRDVPVGLSKRQIDNLPPMSITQSHVDKKEECIICMDEFALGAAATLLPCFHFFHPGCIKPWFETKNECPTCRHDARTNTPPNHD